MIGFEDTFGGPDVVGIDPGLGGGIAVLQSRLVCTCIMPTIKAKKRRELDLDLLHEKFSHLLTSTEVWIERQQAMGGQGVTSTGTTMLNYGKLIGLLHGLGVSYHVVHPRKWQKEIFGDRPRGDPKGAALSYVQSTFEGLPLTANNRCRKPHTGIVDALCIAMYGRRQGCGTGRPTE